MITIRPENTLCANADEFMQALEADKESAVVVVLVDSDAEMLAINGAVNKKAAVLQSAAMRFGKPTEFWKGSGVYLLDENRWKMLIVRSGITAEQIVQAQQAQAMQRLAEAAMLGGTGVPDVLKPGRR
jgi:hypothetical protein